MRKLKTEKRFREQRKKQKELIENLRENGMKEADIQSYMQMMEMSQMIEIAANDVVAKKNMSTPKTEETTTEEKEVDNNVQG
jgi:hypothetical protein